MERELEKTLMEIECSIKNHEQRGNTHTQSVLEQARDIIAMCAQAARTPSELKEIIRNHMNDGWIPVDKTNIPKNEVLACDRYENELIGYLSYDANAEEFVCESDGCIMYQVIAWMEKPEPYRPERREK